MNSLYIAILVLAGAWFLAYHRAPILVWTLLVALGLGLWSWFSTPSWYLGGPVWVAFILVAGLLNLSPLRRRWLSYSLLEWLRRNLPTISTTEREALKAGTVDWEAQLFQGAPDWKSLLKRPAARLGPDEQAFLEGPTERLCRMVNEWHVIEERGDLPPEVWAFIKEHRFFGMIIPKEYGGLGFSAVAHSEVVTKLSTRSVVTAVTVMVPNSLGPAELLLEYGTQPQRDHYLPRLARGEEVPCFALTGPEAGSDAAAIPDRGVVCRGEFRGETITGIRLNWDKRYITLGPVATVIGLAFRLEDPDHLLGDESEPGITLALIPTDTPGVEFGHRHNPMGIPFQNGPTRGREVFIPVEWIIGGADRAGEGWRMLMESLSGGRGISLPALSTGAAKLSCHATGAYARIRRQFNRPIGRFEGVGEALARMAGNAYTLDAARLFLAAVVDRGERPGVASAILKYHSTERMRELVNDAMDVHGGKGICKGPHNYIAHIYQALPITITVEGANLLTRNLMIFGQGSLRCHPYLLEEMEAATDPDPKRGLIRFDRAFFAHTGHALSNAARTLFLGLTGAHLTFPTLRGGIRRPLQQLTRMSAGFALTADIALMVLGGSLKRRERLSARLGDVLSQLYLASAAIKRFHDQGAPLEDRPLMRWVCEDALYTAQQRLDALLTNFPNRPLAWLLRAMVFPFGRPHTAPNDRLSGQVAECLLSPSPTRDRLTSGIYLPTEAEEPLAQLEETLEKVVAAEPVESKLRDAVRIGTLSPAPDESTLLQNALAARVIDPSEAERVRAANAARSLIIQVDEFPSEGFGQGSAIWHSKTPTAVSEQADSLSIS